MRRGLNWWSHGLRGWLCLYSMIAFMLGGCVWADGQGPPANASSPGQEGEQLSDEELKRKLSRLEGFKVTLEHPRLEPFHAREATFVVKGIDGRDVHLRLVAHSQDGHLEKICIDAKCVEIDTIVPVLADARDVWLAEPVVRSWYYKSDMIQHFAIYLPFSGGGRTLSKCRRKDVNADRWINNVKVIISRNMEWARVLIRCSGNEVYIGAKSTY